MSELTLRSKIEEAKAEYQERYGKLSWQWEDEGLPYTIHDYHSGVGSVMDFTEDDWRACKENGWTLDDVCILCNEPWFCHGDNSICSFLGMVLCDWRQCNGKWS